MAKWQRINIPIPKGYKPIERKAIAQEVIQFIVDRTKSGKDKDGRNFKGYTKEYKESLTFKLGGKSSSVNLTLTGEMLGELDLLNQSNGNLRIGYDKGREALNGKVEGNREGTYGQKKQVTSPRDFLGLSSSALNKILKKYPLHNDKKRKESTTKAINTLVDVPTEVRRETDE